MSQRSSSEPEVEPEIEIEIEIEILKTGCTLDAPGGLGFYSPRIWAYVMIDGLCMMKEGNQA